MSPTSHWIQPLGDDPILGAFLSRHGEGVHHLAFSVPSDARLDDEVARLHAAGVDVMASATVKTGSGTGRFAYLDTAARGGGLTIELSHGLDPQSPGAATTNEAPFQAVSQYALVVGDVARVGAFYASLGFGDLPIERNVSLNRMLRGHPARFEMLLGFAHVSDVVFEWIQPIVGPSVYDEYLARHGEGFHHLGFNVTDMDAAIARLQSRGLAVTMSGGWDTHGSQGRFAYLDSDKYGGVTIELLWNKPQ